MAEGDEVAGALGGLNPGDARYRQDISFRQSLSFQQAEGFSGAMNLSGGNGAAVDDRFSPDINHACLTA
ncbi:MAG: hypothetical protein OHK005_14440 [Candidatus Methylacidiphilales bacterium]